MTARDDNVNDDQAIEALLRQVPPRPMPRPEETRAVREAVRADWKTYTKRRGLRRRFASLAVAASVLVAVGVAVNSLRVPSAVVEQVATIDKAVGSIYLLGEGSELTETTDLSELAAGQTIVTGKASGAGLTWHQGGVLRIDAETRVTFLSPTDIELRSGRIYFDSHPSTLYAGITQSSASGLSIHTLQGVITHLGTQYMTGINAGALQVSVREGEVRIDGATFDATATAGQRLDVSGSAPSITNIATWGKDWEWIEMTAPVPDLERRSIHEFLLWASRESGLALRFEGAAETIAREKMLVGSADQGPRESLHLLLETTVLEADIDDGWIIVSER